MFESLLVIGALYLLCRKGSSPGVAPSSRVTQGSTRNYFSYEYQDGQWRAYFVGRPSSYTHVLRDGSRYYVCWSDPLRTKEQAKSVAREWERHYA